jgi:8-oxo-dGTP pyrophosphatase MutT (NUDIX family)
MRKLIDLINEANGHVPPTYDADDEPHYDALDKTGFFGAQAAGCIPMAKSTGRVMIVLRSSEVEQPHTWGNLGGAHHADERPVDAAQRELHEETGFAGSAQMVPLYVFQSGTFRYCNFLAIVEDEFVPHLGWEADDYKWVDLGDWPQPLHFGLQALFNDANSVRVLNHYANLFGGHQHG